ncbi:hypothetical protein GAO09_11460 [Rhizobiales bacterium RZME27]|uniref:Uncharacterized protein n=1 Tax=Endobacterium cereale TaxID=2663029 RepID=A0A6A8A5U6_9HYPH|nr:hypothetical protein [Endobacterium cereale]
MADELKRLRRENEVLRQERDILKFYGKRLLAGTLSECCGSPMNWPHFHPDSRHKQKGSSTGLRTGLYPTRIDALNC